MCVIRVQVFIFLCLLFLMNACIKSQQPTGAGSGFCDTSRVSYSLQVLPIVQTYCYPCHGNGNTAFSNGVNLNSYDALKGWADLGYLLGDITQKSGYIGMPYGKPKLSDCEINTIVAWVNQGEPK